MPSASPPAPDPHTALREHLIAMLRGGHAHVVFRDAIADWPVKLRGTKPPGQPFTAWRILEHMRITQWDIVEFAKSAAHVSPEFPDGYWPKDDAPPDAGAWDKCVAHLERDAREMERLIGDPTSDLFARIPHGTGQTLLREALVLAAHTSYHLGQLVLLRRLVGAWPASA